MHHSHPGRSVNFTFVWLLKCNPPEFGFQVISIVRIVIRTSTASECESTSNNL